MERDENLRKALVRFTTPGHPLYDPDFDKEIRALRPDWFTLDGDNRDLLEVFTDEILGNWDDLMVGSDPLSQQRRDWLEAAVVLLEKIHDSFPFNHEDGDDA